jgi:hypothetical protein
MVATTEHADLWNGDASLWMNHDPRDRWDRPASGRLLDHARTWLTPLGGRVMTSEPYNVTPERIAALREWCAAVGFALEVGERSPGIWGRPPC